ncbi:MULTISPECIES: lipopolysaccharide assembly protein LapA domain-containing protein [Pseudomonas]|jgi:uncharacterized integral membrane protein|uniref:DUF1049 domain-containing protein n=1 Tax=Pseudomonas simiae TaxID=321846 RepID=A0A1N7U1D2_9PSED|nr:MULTISPECIES: lipopolysaccharide assembly protein LapA domain-containing protein [Pseudomonas]MBD8742442.1 LapA family protein [Pseudomonas fluorescens]AIB35552.1 hypothetical protein PS417_08160 [Pseudomonas simiae]AJP51323.1 hypothetical protein PF1751_v1c16200 [Pseudomonas simiae]AJZ92112.1 hypothetical protein PFLUOLIPICF7_00220 [Pseudomonas simiae]ERH60944.1 hypothetical protein O204_15365 [Pseudomonas simiae]
MARLRRFASIVSVLFFALVVVFFVLENQQGATLSFFGWSTVELPVSVFTLLALLVGMIVGPAIAVVFGRKKTRQKA